MVVTPDERKKLMSAAYVKPKTTRDQVIEYAKDWVILRNTSKCFEGEFESITEMHDVYDTVVQLAFNRTKDALLEYVKERENKFAAHDRMLEDIEELIK